MRAFSTNEDRFPSFDLQPLKMMLIASKSKIFVSFQKVLI
jgi:hypothetical protein